VPPHPPAEWWRSAVLYEIYVRSFADSDGDGVGDLPGIRSHLPYLRELGVDGIWLTPFYPSPGADHGYDVSDYVDVDRQFGSLADFDGLVEDAHALGLRVVIDIVPNHTSNEHAWFRNAISDQTHTDRARYLFRPGRDGGPPNNWKAAFGGPAWTLDEASEEYYLHLFAPEQPDLDWHNESVRRDFEEILRFWLDRGVDGFRIDVGQALYKERDLHDVDDDAQVEPVSVCDQRVEVDERPELRIDVDVVRDVVTVIHPRRRIERCQPDPVDAQVAQVGQARADPPEIADAVAVGIGEAPDVDLIERGAPPPLSHPGSPPPPLSVQPRRPPRRWRRNRRGHGCASRRGRRLRAHA